MTTYLTIPKKQELTIKEKMKSKFECPHISNSINDFPIKCLKSYTTKSKLQIHFYHKHKTCLCLGCQNFESLFNKGNRCLKNICHPKSIYNNNCNVENNNCNNSNNFVNNGNDNWSCSFCCKCCNGKSTCCRFLPDEMNKKIFKMAKGKDTETDCCYCCKKCFISEKEILSWNESIDDNYFEVSDVDGRRNCPHYNCDFRATSAGWADHYNNIFIHHENQVPICLGCQKSVLNLKNTIKPMSLTTTNTINKLV